MELCIECSWLGMRYEAVHFDHTPNWLALATVKEECPANVPVQK